MAVEKNERGQLLLRPIDLAKQAGGAIRYNGGWVKHVTGLDKSKPNGYGILGEFVSDDRIQWLSPGLYLDCGKGGSRKNQVWYYTLFLLKPDGTVECVAEVDDQKNWAVKLWPVIEEALLTFQPAEEKVPDKLKTLLERREKLAVELAALDEQILYLSGVNESPDEIRRRLGQ